MTTLEKTEPDKSDNQNDSNENDSKYHFVADLSYFNSNDRKKLEIPQKNNDKPRPVVVFKVKELCVFF